MGKNYRQFCGLAKASSVLGERWALLIVRDLSVAPRRFKDLHEGLAGIPTSVLTARLRDLQEAGVVERSASELPGGGVFYKLTAQGQDLAPILDALGRWGAKNMAIPGPDDVITDTSLAAALRSGYQPSAKPARYMVQAGSAQAWVEVTPHQVTVGAGAPEFTPDLTIHSGPELRLLLAGRLTPSAALSSGAIRIDGPTEIFERFAQAFHVPLADNPKPHSFAT